MKILVLPGDGIGPEITAATLAVLDRANARFGLGLEWDIREIGFAALKACGSTFPEDIQQATHEAPGIILGPISHLDYPPKEPGRHQPFRLASRPARPLRQHPAREIAQGVGLTGKPMDLVIFRECTEGFYGDRNMFMGRGEFMPAEDVAIAVHKANVLQMSDGLFLREVRAVAKNYPDAELDENFVDAMAALLVRIPGRFDCIVTGNMFGDILSDEASEISGGLGLAGSTLTGDNACCAQAQHGSAPDIAGQDRANPVSLLLSSAMLLEWLGAKHRRPEFDVAPKALEAAIDVARFAAAL